MAVSVLNVAEVAAACHILGFKDPGSIDYDALSKELNTYFGRKTQGGSIQTFASNCRTALSKRSIDPAAVLTRMLKILDDTGFEGEKPTSPVIPKGKAGQGSETDAEYEARIRELAAKRKGGKVLASGSIGFDEVA